MNRYLALAGLALSLAAAVFFFGNFDTQRDVRVHNGPQLGIIHVENWADNGLTWDPISGTVVRHNTDVAGQRVYARRLATAQTVNYTYEDQMCTANFGTPTRLFHMVHSGNGNNTCLPGTEKPTVVHIPVDIYL